MKHGSMALTRIVRQNAGVEAPVFALVAKNTLTLFVAFSQTEVFGAFDKARE